MDDHDDALMARLAYLMNEVDPVPADVLAAAQAAIGMRDLDGELAALVGDSAADSADLRFDHVRDGAGHGRLLSFTGGGVQIDVEVTGRGELSLVGRVAGAATPACVLEQADGLRHELHLDGLGRFMVNALAPGPARLRCRSAGEGRTVATTWVNL